MRTHSTKRRNFLKQLGAGLAVSYAGFPGMAKADNGPGSPLFVFLNLNGAADGLDLLRPVFDPGYQTLRANVPNALEGLDLGAGAGSKSFKLNKNLPVVHDMYKAGHALLFHAVGLNYATAANAARSHFASQQMLQTMSNIPYRLRTGMLGRLSMERQIRSMADSALVPTVLQSPRKDLINTWSAKVGQVPTADFVRRWTSMYGEASPIATTIQNAYKAALVTLPPPQEQIAGAQKSLYNALQFGLVNGASQFAVSMGGWDAHSAEWDEQGVYDQVPALNGVISVIKSAFASRWNDVVVLVSSEFGRTAAPNGSGGTDHGTATIAMLLGGNINGGRVVTRWPGMQPAQLHQGRDLAITLDIHQLCASALSQHFKLTDTEKKAIFPMPLVDIPEFAANKLFKAL